MNSLQEIILLRGAQCEIAAQETKTLAVIDIEIIDFGVVGFRTRRRTDVFHFASRKNIILYFILYLCKLILCKLLIINY